MAREINTRDALYMQEVAAISDVSSFTNAICPKRGHFDTFAVLNAVDLAPGESVEVYGNFLTKVAMFSVSAPRFERIHIVRDIRNREDGYTYDSHGAEYIQDYKPGATQWLAVNETWSGGTYPKPLPHGFLETLGSLWPADKFRITAKATTHVVLESVLSKQEIVPPAPFNGRTHSLHYDPSNYDPPGPAVPLAERALELHKLPKPSTCIKDRIFDTLVWDDSVSTAELHYNGEPRVTINAWTSKAVQSGYFGRVRRDGSMEYSTGVLNARMFENAVVHVTKCTAASKRG
jgi:hypothetical protein